MEDLDYWRLCDDLSVIEAALLIVGVDPSSREGVECKGMQPHEQPREYAATCSALMNAIRGGKLNARVRYPAQPRYEASIDNLIGAHQVARRRRCRGH